MASRGGKTFSMEEREKKPICKNIHSSGTQYSVLIQEAQQLSRLINFKKYTFRQTTINPQNTKSKENIFYKQKEKTTTIKRQFSQTTDFSETAMEDSKQWNNSSTARKQVF